MIARNLAAVGLHPSLGIHHHNKYNNFCLADDLLEPYRPIIDKYIVHKFGIGLTHFELDQKTRQSLLQIFDLEVLIDNNTTSFKAAIRRSASSLVNVVMSEAEELILPTS